MPTPRSVFLTGASSGLGRGLALHYARAGATVHAAARRKDELAKLAAEAPEGSIVPVVLDVADTDALVAALRKTEMTAKNKFPMPFLMELADAVKVMARGIERGAKTISYPLPMVAVTRTLGAIPASLYEPLAGRVRMF